MYIAGRQTISFDFRPSWPETNTIYFDIDDVFLFFTACRHNLLFFNIFFLPRSGNSVPRTAQCLVRAVSVGYTC